MPQTFAGYTETSVNAFEFNPKNQEVVDRKLDGRIEDQPEVAEQRVSAIVANLSDGEVEEEAASLDDALAGLDDRPDRTLFRSPHGQPKRLSCHGRERIAPTPYTDRTCPRARQLPQGASRP